MATNLQLDDRLIGKAQKPGNHRTKKAAVTQALSDYISRLQQEKILKCLYIFVVGLTTIAPLFVSFAAEFSASMRPSVAIQAQEAFKKGKEDEAWELYEVYSDEFEKQVPELELAFLGWLMARCDKEYGQVNNKKYGVIWRAAVQQYVKDPDTDPVGYAEGILIVSELKKLTQEYASSRAWLKKLHNDKRAPRDFRDMAAVRLAEIDRIVHDTSEAITLASSFINHSNAMIRSSAILVTAHTLSDIEKYQKAKEFLGSLEEELPADEAERARQLREHIDHSLMRRERARRMPIPCFGPFDIIDVKNGETISIPFSYPEFPYPTNILFRTSIDRGGHGDREEVPVVQQSDTNFLAQITIERGKPVPGDGKLQIQENDLIFCEQTHEFKLSPSYRRIHTNHFWSAASIAVYSIQRIIEREFVPANDPSSAEDRETNR